MVCSWIQPHIILNNMNIIFPFIFLLFEWLAVIIWIIQENSIKWNKLKKYRKSLRNVPHWNMEYQVLYENCRKSLEVKSEKIWFAECQKITLGKSPLCRVSGEDTRQRVNGSCRPLTAAALCRVFWFAECPTLGKSPFCRVLLFAECSALGKPPLCRVPVVC